MKNYKTDYFDFKIIDDSQAFALDVCELIVKSREDFKNIFTKTRLEDLESDERFSDFLESIETFSMHFENNIIDFYQFDVPLFALRDLISDGKDRWGMTDEKYESELHQVWDICREMYSESV